MELFKVNQKAMHPKTKEILDTLIQRWPEDINTPGTRAFKELRLLVSHPLQIITSLRLTENHPIKLQALTILDAWDSVTNGMENTEAWERLEALRPTDVFYPWKSFIFALSHFYKNNDDEAIKSLSFVGEDNALTSSAKKLTSYLQKKVKQIIHGLSQVPPSYLEAVEQLETLAYPETEDFFIETLEHSIRLFQDVSIEIENQFLTWVIRFCADRGLALERILPVLRERIEGSRVQQLAAIALFPYSPETSLLFWARSAADATTPLPDNFLSVLRLIETETLKYQKQYGEDPAFRSEWPPLSSRLQSVLKGWAPMKNPVIQEKSPETPWKTQKSNGGQLELFAS